VDKQTKITKLAEVFYLFYSNINNHINVKFHVKSTFNKFCLQMFPRFFYTTYSMYKLYYRERLYMGQFRIEKIFLFSTCTNIVYTQR